MSGRNSPAPILILAGGKGTRLHGIDPARPKPMVQVLNKPFLHWLVEHYNELGFTEFLVSTGHKAEVIESYPWPSFFPNARFQFYRELQPLGTGGAVESIFVHSVNLQDCWVINGDTYLPLALPLPPEDYDALYTVLGQSDVFDASPNLFAEERVCNGKKGQFIVAEESIEKYEECRQLRSSDGSARPRLYFFDAGAVYVTRKAVLSQAQQGLMKPFSLHQLLAPAMASFRVGYELLNGACYDIGTPERLKRFEEFLCGKIKESALSSPL